MIKLGDKVRDLITGFAGVATVKAEYLNGCIQFFVRPQELKDGVMIKGAYIDVGQLKKISGGVKIKKGKVEGPGGVMSNSPPERYGDG